MNQRNREWVIVMKAFPAIVLLLAFLSVGCVQTRQLGGNSALTYDSLNVMLSAKEATVKLKDGQELKVRDMYLASDSTSWIDAGSHSKDYVVTSEIESIEIINEKRGASLGMGYGFIAGAVIGGAIGLGFGDDEDIYHEEECFFIGCTEAYTVYGRSAEGKAVLVGLGVGILGGIVGKFAGAASGSTDRFEFSNTTPVLPSNESQSRKDSTIVARQQ